MGFVGWLQMVKVDDFISEAVLLPVPSNHTQDLEPVSSVWLTG